MQITKADLVCPLCEQQMTVVSGLVRIPHFRHLSKCSDLTPRHPESIKHLLGKVHVADQLKSLYGDTVKVDFEVRLEQVGRIADVFAVMDGGWLWAHEVQLASITTEEIIERTKTYLGAGIDVTWWLGEKANTATNRYWVSDNFGDVRILEFKLVDSNWR